MSLSHQQIWQAIDGLAQRHGLTPSGLARRAGLDPTTFNRSKRTAGGKLRWPSTESLAKALAALNVSVRALVELVEDAGSASTTTAPGPVPAALGLEAIAATGPAALELPGDGYVLELGGDQFRPLYRKGDRLLISPSLPVRPGDRVVVKTCAGRILIRELARATPAGVELCALAAHHPDSAVARPDIAFLHRIVWASQ